MTLRITTVVGARPQFIKAAALSRALKKHPNIKETIVHTGQHFDPNMSDVFFKELDIPKPQYSLNINSGPHGQMTGRMLERIEAILQKDKPDAVLVYGDTNSTLAGALAASKLHISVIHIEAGLRSYNKKMPEETNRILTDHMSTLLFCPTITAVENLKKEGISKGIHHLGDVMHDATLYAIERVKNDSNLMERFSFLPERFALMTVHRAESTESLETFQKIMTFCQNFSKENSMKVIFPIHPRTRSFIDFEKYCEDFIFLDPLSYFETQYCLSKASYVLTDSGGLQKEAYFHRVPCVTLRSETEWIETIECGWNRLWKIPIYNEKKCIQEYGLGNTSEKIIFAIKKELLS